MGAWGHQFDENDDAGDWLGNFEDEPSWERVREALRNVQKASEEYLEAPEASMGLAAAEIVAAGLGKSSPRLLEGHAGWAKANAEGAIELRDLGRDTVTRIRNEGELLELWQESGEADNWLATVDDLLNRLN